MMFITKSDIPNVPKAVLYSQIVTIEMEDRNGDFTVVARMLDGRSVALKPTFSFNRTKEFYLKAAEKMKKGEVWDLTDPNDPDFK